MIFLLAYVAAVWAGAYQYRRRWIGYVIALGSVVPVGVVFVFGAEAWLPGASRTSPAVLLTPLAYATLVMAGGLLFASQRSKPGFACRECGYDLAGNVTGVCPECGGRIQPG